MSRFNYKKAVHSAAAVSLAALVLWSCTTALSKVASCERYNGKYPIEYAGGALGKGELEMKVLPGRVDLLEGRLTLWDETGTDAVLTLEGPGSCENGVVHIVFGGGDHPQSRVRVIGGSATLVPAGGKVERLFGIWSAEAQIKNSGQQRSLTGYFRGLTRS